MSGIPPLVRAIVRARAENACERCGEFVTTMGDGEIHHRKPRGMGGTSDPAIHCPSNLVFVCRSCHRWIESNRTVALTMGWLVRQSEAPNEHPVSLWARGWTYLDPDGRYAEGSP